MRIAAHLILGVVVMPVLLVAVTLIVFSLIYSPAYVVRVITFGVASVDDYQKFPERPMAASRNPLQLYSDLRQLALHETQIVDPPGRSFLYNNYHPLLLGMILERTTGMTVTRYLQAKIWGRIGTEYGGSWSTDRAGGLEKLESGINARAI